MNEQKHIVFLYSQRFVPPQIIQMAQAQVPPGFTLDLLEQDTSTEIRLEKFADVVTIHTPLTPETQGLINTRALSLMKPSAILVNTSRGPVIDETALVTALREGRIAGAGLDVFAIEPLPADHPLLSLENVVLTSHIAGVTLDTWSRQLAFAFANARQVAAGKKPESVVAGL